MRKVNTRKWIKLAVMVAVFAALLVLPQPVQYYTAYGQGYGYDTGAGVPSEPVAEDVSDIVNSDGEFTSSATITSADGTATLEIPRGTIGLDADGDPLSIIAVTNVSPPDDPPSGSTTLGITFDCEPSGATFDPPAELTFEYNPNWLPPGATPDNLTIAYYDEDTGQWVELGAEDIVIDPETNTIRARVSHFTVFSVLVRTNPAAFEVGTLVFPSTAVGVAEKATISAMVTNTGDLTGSTTVTLKINGVAVANKTVKLNGGELQKVSFTTVQGAPGDYKVEIDGLSGMFTVKAATLIPVVISSTVPSITVPSATPAPTAPAVPAAPAPVPAPTPWTAIIISLVVAVIVAGILVWNYGFRTY